MPSLRRTLSSPSVRSSPYSNGLLVARGSGYHRRSSGSETTNRRVLADIEWWKVTDGQCDADELEDRNRGDPDIFSFDVSSLPIITHADNGVEHPLPSISAFTATSIEHPTEQFSTLSITPHTPTHRHHSLGSSSSSLESTPEPAESPLESLGLRLLDIGMGFAEVPSFPTFLLDKPSRAVIPSAFTFSDCLFMDDQVNQYADFAVSPLSSSPNFLN